MIVYKTTKEAFINDIFEGVVQENLEQSIYNTLNLRVSKSELRSWNNSLSHMNNILQYSTIPNDTNIAIEFKIPHTNKRVDFIISGLNAEEQGSVVLIELKQWEQATKSLKDGIVVTELGKGIRESVHPSYQAYSYASLIEDYNEAVRNNNIELHPCAYLHNYNVDKHQEIIDKHYDYYLAKAPLFGKKDNRSLVEFINKNIKYSNSKIIDYIDYGKILPSKALQDYISKMLKGNNEFVLIDEQKLVYENIISAILREPDKKQVFMIKGGPGTGKSVVAINLLVKILNLSKNTFYVSKNTAPREVYKAKLRNNKFKLKDIDHLFSGSGAFHNLASNTFDCLIVDEAHRLNAKSGIYSNIGENQIKELINSSIKTVFFVDDNQLVTMKDIGSSKEIKAWANYLNAEIIEYELH